MLILEFTLDRVKLLRMLKRGQRLALMKLSKTAIGGFSDDDIAAAVLDLLNTEGAKRKEPLLICVPRHLFTVRNLRLPSLDDAELRDMAGLQAGKQLPYPADEMIWDFNITEKRPDGYSDISLILGHRNVTDRFIGILKKSNLETNKIILSSEALLAWYLSASGFKDGEEADGRIQAVINIDTSHVDIIIIKGGIMEFSRSFPFKNEPEEMAEEIRKTFNSYQKDNPRQIASVAITGIEGKAAAIKGLLEKMEGARPVEFIHPLKIVSGDYRETLSDYSDLARDSSFACVLGIAYNAPAINMDFMPPELKTARAAKEKKKRLAGTALLLGAIAFLLVGISLKGAIDRKREADLLGLRIKDTEPRVKELREISQQIEIVKQNLNMKGSSVDAMREVFKIVPPEISISVLDFELGSSLTLRGVSSDLSSVFKFASGLEASRYFEDSEIKYAQKRVAKEKEFVDFEITCSLSKVPK